MENNENDYLKELSEEDKIALLEIKRKREREDKERFDIIYDELYEKESHNKIVLVATLLSAIVIVCGIYIIVTSAKKTKPVDPDETSKTIPIDGNRIRVVRNYVVKYNDTLIGLSEMSGMSVSDIKKENNLSSDLIKINQKLDLTYTINSDDIKYCTDSIDVNGRNIYDIAGLYDTTAQSIYNLNKESIQKVVKDASISYIILSDTLLVPNYKTPKEIENVKKLG